MKLRMVGCSHRKASLEIRQHLAFDAQQTVAALNTWQGCFPHTELALLSTCNRVELYAAGNRADDPPEARDLIEALLEFQQLPLQQVEEHFATLDDSQVVQHLYRVAGSLDSMVVGEPQILAQVKQAYQYAQACCSAGPLLHDLFQSALRTAKRITGETSLHKHRVSIPSVAIADLAASVFERFDDKYVLVIGAGEMAEETLRYLRTAGDARIHVINRDAQRGRQLAEKWGGEYHPWETLWDQLVQADLAISITAASEPIVSAQVFDQHVAPRRYQRPLVLLDLAVPRDFDPLVGEALGVYLYSLDDLDQACQRNREARAAELPAAESIVLQETGRFLADVHHRATAPVISSLRRGFQGTKDAELDRLFKKLSPLDPQVREEIEKFADRMVNKMLHPPLESLRDASQNGTPHGLLDALRRLFYLED